MAQPIQQVALRAPGFQGINTELSPINGDPEFALVADNVVVDQIGRLTSRKAFADYQYIGELVPIDVSLPITNDKGFGPSGLSGYNWNDNVITITNKNGVEGFITPTMIDGFDGDPERSTYTLTLSVSFKSKTSGLIADPAKVFPDSIGRIEVTQDRSTTNNGVIDLFCNHTREDGLAIPVGGIFVPAHRFTYTSAIGVDTRQIEIDPLKPVEIRFRAKTAVPSSMGVEIEVSIDRLDIDGFALGARGFNEIITLGKDVIGVASAEQEQSNFRPVFIYRYGDGFIYPTDYRTVPVGMRRQMAASRNTPELGGSIKYAVGSYNVGDTEFTDLVLPDDYENECLLTGNFVNFSAEDLTTGNDRLLLFVKGKPFLRLDNDTQFTPVTDGWKDGAGNNYPIDGDIAVSAYGRVWVTGVGGDYHQIHYSALLDETEWYEEGKPAKDEDEPFNDAGIIDVREYWPVDGDTIVNIHAHNGFLVVFGRNSILLYANADSGTPAGVLGQASSGIFLQDTISNVGLVRRDALCNIGTDVLFVDDSGVRSLGRVIQEKSTPIQEPSLNIRRELQEVIKQELAGGVSLSAIKLEYFPSESLAVLLFSSLKIAYAFHLATPSKTGGMKVTRWTDCFWNDGIEIKRGQEDIVFMAGKPTKGLLKYQDYLKGTDEGEITPYIMRYESMALAIGSSPMQTIIPKSIHFVCMGEYVPGQANALWGFSDKFIGNQEFLIKVDGGSTYNVNYFDDDGDVDLAGRYRDGGIRYDGYKINTTGSGELFRVGFQVKVQGGRYALQEINVNTAIGRLRA